MGGAQTGVSVNIDSGACVKRRGGENCVAETAAKKENITGTSARHRVIDAGGRRRVWREVAAAGISKGAFGADNIAGSWRRWRGIGSSGETSSVQHNRSLGVAACCARGAGERIAWRTAEAERRARLYMAAAQHDGAAPPLTVAAAAATENICRLCSVRASTFRSVHFKR